MRGRIATSRRIRRHAVALSLAVVGMLFVSNVTEDISRILIRGFQSSFLQKKTLDDLGVPIVQYGYVDWIYIGRQRNPVTVSQKALEYYDKYKKGDTSCRQLFLNCADWLVSNATPHKNYRILEYQFPWPVYNLTPPWRSGMAQGQALQVLIRAHEITQDEDYIDCGKQLLNAFFIEVEDGGVTHKTPDAGWWYEEYAGEGAKISRVLNGMMFALLGIREFYEYTGDSDAEYLFEQGVLALRMNLQDYDRDGASLYDILGKPAEGYREIHVWQLERLHELTDEVVFREYAEKWGSHRRAPFIVRLLQAPLTKMEAAILLANFVGLLIVSEIALAGVERRRRTTRGCASSVGLRG